MDEFQEEMKRMGIFIPEQLSERCAYSGIPIKFQTSQILKATFAPLAKVLGVNLPSMFWTYGFFKTISTPQGGFKKLRFQCIFKLKSLSQVSKGNTPEESSVSFSCFRHKKPVYTFSVWLNLAQALT